jgi:hypothetical protein
MPTYTIETTYTLPIFRHGTYIADTPEAACKMPHATTIGSSSRRTMIPQARSM